MARGGVRAAGSPRSPEVRQTPRPVRGTAFRALLRGAAPAVGGSLRACNGLPDWLAAALLALLPAAGAWSADAERGKALYGQECKRCHQAGGGAEHRIGPHLNDVFDRAAGSLSDYGYSPAMQAAGAGGLVWTEAIARRVPRRPAGGGAALAHELRRRGERRATGRTSSPGCASFPAPARTFRRRSRPPPPRSTASTPRLLAVPGDPEYGAYLAGECTTCHRGDGAAEGIPSITGWPRDDFVIALQAYKRGKRVHPAMQLVAGRLSDEEIAALAAHFSRAGTSSMSQEERAMNQPAGCSRRTQPTSVSRVRGRRVDGAVGAGGTGEGPPAGGDRGRRSGWRDRRALPRQGFEGSGGRDARRANPRLLLLLLLEPPHRRFSRLCLHRARLRHSCLGVRGQRRARLGGLRRPRPADRRPRGRGQSRLRPSRPLARHRLPSGLRTGLGPHAAEPHAARLQGGLADPAPQGASGGHAAGRGLLHGGAARIPSAARPGPTSASRWWPTSSSSPIRRRRS